MGFIRALVTNACTLCNESASVKKDQIATARLIIEEAKLSYFQHVTKLIAAASLCRVVKELSIN